MWKLLFFANLMLCLSACDFMVSLSGGPETAIDERATGLWERKKADNRMERLLVLPLNGQEYFINWPRGAKTELYAKAHLFNLSGQALVQIEWFGNSDGATPDDGRKYQVARYDIDGGKLTISLLNSDVTGKDFTSAEKLAGAVRANKDNPDLFREVFVFNRVN